MIQLILDAIATEHLACSSDATVLEELGTVFVMHRSGGARCPLISARECKVVAARLIKLAYKLETEGWDRDPNRA